MIATECHNCGQHIEAGDEMAGRAAACPTCGHSMLVPRPRKTKAEPEGNWLVAGLRWLAVLPAALITSVAIGYVFKFVNFVTRPLQAPSLLELVVNNVLGAAIGGAAFVWAGTYVAPVAKKETGIVLCTLLGIGGLAVVGRATNGVNTTFALIGALVMLGGGIYAAMQTEPTKA